MRRKKMEVGCSPHSFSRRKTNIEQKMCKEKERKKMGGEKTHYAQAQLQKEYTEEREGLKFVKNRRGLWGGTD